MKNDDELMFAEDLFGEPELKLENEKKTPVRKRRGRAKKSADDLFADVKVKMVMRVYGVTKARALEMLAERAEAKEQPEAPAGEADGIEDDDEDDGFMSAAEFFGARS